MNKNLYCPVTGLRVNSSKEWTDIPAGIDLKISMCSIGDAVIYSKPSGHADISNAMTTFKIYQKARSSLLKNSNNYIYIGDFQSLENSSADVRRLYSSMLSESKILSTMIFCNTVPRIQMALKMTAQFHVSGKQIHICKNYPEAIKLALKLAEEMDIPVNKELGIPELIGLSDSSVLSPVKVVPVNSPETSTKTLSNPVYIIDDDIFYSKPAGTILRDELTVVDTAWNKACERLEPGKNIKYLLFDVNRVESFQSNAHRAYGRMLLSIHKNNPLNMYITFSNPEKFRSVSKIAQSLMPFKVKNALDFREAWRLIQNDKSGKKHEDSAKQTSKNDDLLEFLYNIDWKIPGVEIPVPREHPQYTAMTAFKLIKEETDILLQENREKEEALKRAAEEKSKLLQELQHRIKNSFALMIGMIQFEKYPALSKETIEALTNLENKFEAISALYDLLDFTQNIGNTTLNIYLQQLVQRHRMTQEGISFETNLDEVSLHPREITPIGLIVTELIINSIKHAFKGINDKKINIVLKNTDPGFILEYSDNGTGYVTDKPKTDGTSLGQGLISALAEQIGAAIDYPAGEGFHCTLRKEL